MNSGTLSLETATNKSNFQKKTIIVEWNIKHQKKSNLHLFETNLTEKKIRNPSNAKEYYQSYLKRKNSKPVKPSRIITQQLKATENPNILNIKSEHCSRL